MLLLRACRFRLPLIAAAGIVLLVAVAQPRNVEAALTDCADPRYGNTFSVWSWDAGGDEGVLTLLKSNDPWSSSDLIAVSFSGPTTFPTLYQFQGDASRTRSGGATLQAEDDEVEFMAQVEDASMTGTIERPGPDLDFEATLIECHDNLAPNPSLELKGNSPAAWEFFAGFGPGWRIGDWDHRVAFAGRRSFKFGSGFTYLTFYGWCVHAAEPYIRSDPIPVDDDETYALTVRHRGQTVDGMKSSDFVWVHFFDASGNPVPTTAPPFFTHVAQQWTDLSGGPDWHYVVLSPIDPPPGTTNVRIRLMHSGPATAMAPEDCPTGKKIWNWYDDVAFYQLP